MKRTHVETQLAVEQTKVDQLTKDLEEARDVIRRMVIDNPHRDGLWVLVKRWDGYEGDAVTVSTKTRERFERQWEQLATFFAGIK